ERVAPDQSVLLMGRGDAPGWNVAQRFRLQPDEIDEVRDEIYELLRARGRHACTWEVGSHATPANLTDELLARGLVDDEPNPFAVGMVLTEPPAQGPVGVEVRRAETPDEYLQAERIAAIAFGGPEPTKVAPPEDPNNVTYLAYVDGKAVARASGSFGEHAVSLFGGSTLPEARGHGAYRALVAARWEDAVARGTPVLVTQAGQ